MTIILNRLINNRDVVKTIVQKGFPFPLLFKLPRPFCQCANFLKKHPPTFTHFPFGFLEKITRLILQILSIKGISYMYAGLGMTQRR